jgi:hypothetical protein
MQALFVMECMALCWACKITISSATANDRESTDRESYCIQRQQYILKLAEDTFPSRICRSLKNNTNFSSWKQAVVSSSGFFLSRGCTLAERSRKGQGGDSRDPDMREQCR